MLIVIVTVCCLRTLIMLPKSVLSTGNLLQKIAQASGKRKSGVRPMNVSQRKAVLMSEKVHFIAKESVTDKHKSTNLSEDKNLKPLFTKQQSHKVGETQDHRKKKQASLGSDGDFNSSVTEYQGNKTTSGCVVESYLNPGQGFLHCLDH